MKKAFLLLAMPALSLMSFAQSIGGQIGGNFSSIAYKYTGTGSSGSSTAKTTVGFLVGVVAEIPVVKSLNFRPELNYIQKGGKLTGSGSEATFQLNYVELPLNFTYKIDAGPGKVYFGAGPSVGFGLSGKAKAKVDGFDESSTTVKFDGKENATDDKAHFKAIDFGASILAGYEFDFGVTANIGYNLGFSNYSTEKDNSFKNRGFQLKVGYLFMKSESKKKK